MKLEDSVKLPVVDDIACDAWGIVQEVRNGIYISERCNVAMIEVCRTVIQGLEIGHRDWINERVSRSDGGGGLIPRQIVQGLRPCVVKEQVQTVSHPLLDRDLQGVVAGIAAGVGRRDGLTETTVGRRATRRIEDSLSTHEWVQLQILPLVAAVCRHVGRLKGKAAADLLLESKIPGINPRILESFVRIVREPGLHGNRGCRRWRLRRRKWIGDAVTRVWTGYVDNRSWRAVVEAGGGDEWRAVGVDVEERAVDAAVKEHAGTAAQTGFAIAENIVGKTEPRHEVVVCRVHAVGIKSGIAGE